MDMQRIDSAISGNWTGRGELWLDPEGNKAEYHDCTLTLQNRQLRYTWQYDSKMNTGTIDFDEDGAIWKDSWHHPTPVRCQYVSDSWGLFTLKCTYEVPENPDWGWKINLSQRSDGTLVLQMTNIAPWGEEGRAVRMIFSRD